MQRIFETVEAGANNRRKNSFVLLSAEGEYGTRLWMAKALLICRLEIPVARKERGHICSVYGMRFTDG